MKRRFGKVGWLALLVVLAVVMLVFIAVEAVFWLSAIWPALVAFPAFHHNHGWAKFYGTTFLTVLNVLAIIGFCWLLDRYVPRGWKWLRRRWA